MVALLPDFYEYFVLPSLMLSAVLCRGIDFIFGEDQTRHAAQLNRKSIDETTGKGALEFKDKKDAELWLRYVADKTLKSARPDVCKTTWLWEDPGRQRGISS